MIPVNFTETLQLANLCHRTADIWKLLVIDNQLNAPPPHTHFLGESSYRGYSGTVTIVTGDTHVLLITMVTCSVIRRYCYHGYRGYTGTVTIVTGCTQVLFRYIGLGSSVRNTRWPGGPRPATFTLGRELFEIAGPAGLNLPASSGFNRGTRNVSEWVATVMTRDSSRCRASP